MFSGNEQSDRVGQITAAAVDVMLLLRMLQRYNVRCVYFTYGVRSLPCTAPQARAHAAVVRYVPPIVLGLKQFSEFEKQKYFTFIAV